MTERTWEIADIDGSNRRRVTLAEFMADHAKAQSAAKPIMDAVRRGDLSGVAKAQAAMRKQMGVRP